MTGSDNQETTLDGVLGEATVHEVVRLIRSLTAQLATCPAGQVPRLVSSLSDAVSWLDRWVEENPGHDFSRLAAAPEQRYAVRMPDGRITHEGHALEYVGGQAQSFADSAAALGLGEVHFAVVESVQKTVGTPWREVEG